MAFSSPAANGPMGEMNTTPLIDVMLVLLIMFIMVIPAATDAVEIDLPTNCKSCPLPPLGELRNKITIDSVDRVLWNGAPITREELAAVLAASKRLPIEPELQFEPAANASYNASARTLAVIKASGVTRFGFVGNERYREF